MITIFISLGVVLWDCLGSFPAFDLTLVCSNCDRIMASFWTDHSRQMQFLVDEVYWGWAMETKVGREKEKKWERVRKGLLFI